MKKLKNQNLENIDLKPGNIESLIQSTKESPQEGSGEVSETLQEIHTVLDELNGYALDMLKNIDHKVVKVRYEEPKPIKKNNS